MPTGNALAPRTENAPRGRGGARITCRLKFRDDHPFTRQMGGCDAFGDGLPDWGGENSNSNIRVRTMYLKNRDEFPSAPSQRATRLFA